MLKVTRLADYACSIMLTFARSPLQNFTASKIAEINHIGLPVTRKILKQLLEQQLLSSSRGAQGGYQLSRPADQISLANIVEAIDGPISLTVCCQTTISCEHRGHCGTQNHWQKINLLLKRELHQAILANLITPPTFQTIPLDQEVSA